MVTLDNHTRNTKTLNTVWVDSTLCEPLSIGNLLCLSVKHLNEVTTNNLTLLLWVGNTFQILKELFRCINADNVQSKSLISIHHLCKLVLTEHTVVYEDTSKVLTDSLIEQYCTNRRVNTTRKTKDNTVVTHLLTNLLNSTLYK